MNEDAFWPFVAGFLSSSWKWNGSNAWDNCSPSEVLEGLKEEFEFAVSKDKFNAEYYKDYFTDEEYDEDNDD